MTSFSTVKIRTAAAVLCQGEVALIHRAKTGGDQYTLPGGNVEAGEAIDAALRRELAEELGLRLEGDTEPQLLAVQDQMVSRPGATPAPRKLHLIFQVSVSSAVRDSLATVEHDDLDSGRIVWRPLTQLAGLHLFPAVGDVLARLDPGHGVGAVLLPPLTDETYTWV